MRASYLCHISQPWRLPTRWVSTPRTTASAATAALRTGTRGSATSSPSSRLLQRAAEAAAAAQQAKRRRRRRSSAVASWIVMPRAMAASSRAALTFASSLVSPPSPPPPASSASRASTSTASSCAQRSLEHFLAVVERPARLGLAAAATTVAIAVELGLSVAHLGLDVYLYVVSPRLRRFLRFALGIPFLGGTLFLLKMREWYFPEVGSGLDTSCVAGQPLCDSVEDLVEAAGELQHRYHRLLRQHAKEITRRTGRTGDRKSAQPGALNLSLTREEENELLGSILVLVRSIETRIVGTAEERELITPRADVVAAPSPVPTPAAAPAAGVVDDAATNTASAAAAAAAAPTSATGPLTSPAEYVLRVIMSISIAQGWSDITEHTRMLFHDLVRHKTVPVQARIVQAVGELCSLSYELEKGQVDAITMDQRKRIAAAIDAFRPEKSVEERCTIAHEITILPLPDFSHTTRCLGMIRKSPGRKPQLILCFVGTNTWRNWITNFNYWPIPLPASYGVVGTPQPPSDGSASEWVLGGGSGGAAAQPYVHQGFYGLLQTVPFKEVAADFDQIILVGHSLGGALAQLAGLELAAERPSRRITVITMASPRVLAVDWRAHWRFAVRQSREAALHSSSAASPHALLQPGDEHQRDPLAELLTLPGNYRHFRGFLQADVVPHLPPELVHFTHSGQRIPLNTGCSTSLSFVAWGMYSKLYHNADLYQRVLKQPMVSQTHWYVREPLAVEHDVADYAGVHY